jgi:hypothetical protein
MIERNRQKNEMDMIENYDTRDIIQELPDLSQIHEKLDIMIDRNNRKDNPPGETFKTWEDVKDVLISPIHSESKFLYTDDELYESYGGCVTSTNDIVSC